MVQLKMLVLPLFGFVLLTTAVANKQTPLNLTCVLDRIDFCYQNFSTLGANFTVNYTKSRDEVELVCNKTKGGNETVFPCLTKMNNVCHVDLGNTSIAKVRQHVSEVCKQNSQYGSDFLKFASCGNKIINERKKCVTMHKVMDRNDNQKLCCERVNIVKCIYTAARQECGDYIAQTSRNTYNIYGIFHDALCKPYEKKCSGSSRNSFLHLLILLSAFVALLFY